MFLRPSEIQSSREQYSTVPAEREIISIDLVPIATVMKRREKIGLSNFMKHQEEVSRSASFPKRYCLRTEVVSYKRRKRIRFMWTCQLRALNLDPAGLRAQTLKFLRSLQFWPPRLSERADYSTSWYSYRSDGPVRRIFESDHCRIRGKGLEIILANDPCTFLGLLWAGSCI